MVSVPSSNGSFLRFLTIDPMELFLGTSFLDQQFFGNLEKNLFGPTIFSQQGYYVPSILRLFGYLEVLLTFQAKDVSISVHFNLSRKLDSPMLGSPFGMCFRHYLSLNISQA